MYRCRIGNFNSSFVNMTSKPSTSPTSSAPRWTRTLALLLTTMTCLAISIHTLDPSRLQSLQCSSMGSPGLARHGYTSVFCTTWFLSQCLQPFPWPPCKSIELSKNCYIPTNKNMCRSYITTRSELNLSENKLAGEHHILYSISWISAKQRNLSARIINGNRKERGIKILHWNKGPSYLENKYHEIEAIMDNHKPHVLGLSEANLKAEHDQANVQFSDYELHTASSLQNQQLKVSRVVVYTHKSLVVKRRSDLENENISSIWLEVGLPRKRKILICHAYREWKHLYQTDNSSGSIQAQHDRWSLLLDQWERALSEDREVILAMDANIDFLKWTLDNLHSNDSTHRLRPLIEELFERIFPQGVSQMVCTPTRTWPGQPESGLDHLYTNCPSKLSPVCTEFQGGSDHRLIKVTRFSKSLQQRCRYVRKRCYKKFNEEEFKQKVKELSWYDVYECEEVDEAVKLMTNKISKLLDQVAPVRTIQTRTRYAPWLSSETKAAMKARDTAQRNASLSQDPDDWRFYKNLRNTVTARMRLEKTCWEKGRLDHEHNTPTKLWKNIKTWLNWKTAGTPSQLIQNGILINTPEGLATTMNRFFIDKVERLRQSIPASDMDPLHQLRETMSQRSCTFSFRAVHPDEVLEIILKLKNSKSTGIDEVDTYVIKLIAPDIVPAVTHIMNLSIRDACFPTSWKRAKVVPLLKKGDAMDPKNYRPVALLPIFSKILERAIFQQLINYLNENSLLHPNHHGSRRGHNTATALIQMYDYWVNAVESGEMAGAMMLDLSAAFDMVDYSILLEKLKLMGLDQSAVLWMKSYLAGRSQSVCVDGCLSLALPIVCGVPQGSVLGPLLYILFTNDLPDIIHDNHEQPLSYKQPTAHCESCGSLVNYVDDGTYTFSHKDPVVLSAMLSSKYKVIEQYMMSNKLVIKPTWWF